MNLLRRARREIPFWAVIGTFSPSARGSLSWKGRAIPDDARGPKPLPKGVVEETEAPVRIPSPRLRGEGRVSPLPGSASRRQPTVRGRLRMRLFRNRPLTIAAASPSLAAGTTGCLRPSPRRRGEGDARRRSARTGKGRPKRMHPSAIALSFRATAFTHLAGCSGPLSWKKRDRVRCVSYSEMSHTSPQPSPSRRGSPGAPPARIRMLAAAWNRPIRSCVNPVAFQERGPEHPAIPWMRRYR